MASEIFVLLLTLLIGLPLILIILLFFYLLGSGNRNGLKDLSRSFGLNFNGGFLQSTAEGGYEGRKVKLRLLHFIPTRGAKLPYKMDYTMVFSEHMQEKTKLIDVPKPDLTLYTGSFMGNRLDWASTDFRSIFRGQGESAREFFTPGVQKRMINALLGGNQERYSLGLNPIQFIQVFFPDNSRNGKVFVALRTRVLEPVSAKRILEVLSVLCERAEGWKGYSLSKR